MSEASWRGGFEHTVTPMQPLLESDAEKKRQARKRARAETLTAFEQAEVAYRDAKWRADGALEEANRLSSEAEGHRQTMQKHFDILRKLAADDGIRVNDPAHPAPEHSELCRDVCYSGNTGTHLRTVACERKI